MAWEMGSMRRISKQLWTWIKERHVGVWKGVSKLGEFSCEIPPSLLQYTLIECLCASLLSKTIAGNSLLLSLWCTKCTTPGLGTLRHSLRPSNLREVCNLESRVITMSKRTRSNRRDHDLPGWRLRMAEHSFQRSSQSTVFEHYFFSHFLHQISVCLQVFQPRVWNECLNTISSHHCEGFSIRVCYAAKQVSEVNCYKMSGTAKHHSFTTLPFVILLLWTNGDGLIRTKLALHASSRTAGRL